jgi:hypothetical protein
MSRLTWIGWLLAGVLAVQLVPGVLGAPGQQSHGAPPQEPDDALAMQGSLTAAFTYQGFLTDGVKPVNGNRRMEFKLVSSPTMGKVLGGPLTENVLVSDGQFSTQLAFPDSAFDGRALWLTVRVRDTDGSWDDLGAKPILAVPYAASLMPGAKIVETSGEAALVLNNRDRNGLSSTGGHYGVLGITTGTTEMDAGVTGQSMATTGDARGGSFASMNSVGVYAVSLGDDGVVASGCLLPGCFGGRFEGSGGVYAEAKGSSPGPAGQFEGDVLVSDRLLVRGDTVLDDVEVNGTARFNRDVLVSDRLHVHGDTVLDDVEVTGTAQFNRDVRITGRDAQLTVSGPLISGFPRPQWTSGWVSVGKDSSKAMNHNLGGDADDYVVDFQCKDTTGGGAAINIEGIGGYKSGFVPQPLLARGGSYRKLTSSSITVRRMRHDEQCDRIRVRIWVIQ